MNTWVRRTLGASLFTGLLTVAATAGDAKGNYWKGFLTDGELATMVAADAKTIGDALAKGKPDKKAATKAKAAALMVVAYAHGAMAKDPAKAGEFAGLRDKAMAVGNALKDDKFDDAKTLTAELKPGAKGDGKGEIVAVDKLFDLKELMTQFKPEAGGGLALEKNLAKFWNKKGSAPYPAKDVQEMLPLLLRTVVIAQVTEAMTPAADEGKKTREAWVKWTKEMNDSAEEGAKQARQAKPDDKALKAALKKLDASCAGCHAIFRSE